MAWGHRTINNSAATPETCHVSSCTLSARRLRLRSPQLPPLPLRNHACVHDPRKAVVERFGEKVGGWLWDRFAVHYTPKHGSWLNQAKIEISLFSRQCPGPRRIPSLGDLRREARAWSQRMNRDRVTLDWRFTAERHPRSSVTKETTSRDQKPTRRRSSR
jgi:hypothetical protein